MRRPVIISLGWNNTPHAGGDTGGFSIKEKRMSEMVERVARVIVDSWQQDNGWDKQPEYGKELARRCARAAIAAMRRPTSAMCEAPSDVNYDDAYQTWQAMIDAALEG